MGAVARMQRISVVDLDQSHPPSAADLSIERGLATDDAIVDATPRINGARTVTADADFDALSDVTVFARRG